MSSTDSDKQASHSDSCRLDLRGVEEPQRAAAWAHWARELFAGLTVEVKGTPLVGSIQGLQFGAGSLWMINSPPIVVRYRPEKSAAESEHAFSVMLQLEESTVVSQNRHTCELHAQDFCFVDSQYPFELEVSSPSSHVMFLQIPRHAVLGPYPYLKKLISEPFGGDDRGAQLVRTMLSSLLHTAPLLSVEQRGAALGAIARLLGVPRLPSGCGDVGWRVRLALAYIDANYADPELTPDQVAGHLRISRRRLDDLLREAIGESVTAKIWERRLAQAATDLLDPANSTKTVTAIAFSAGFKNTAHFARAFKKRYGHTPRDWRAKLQRENP